MDMYSKNTTIAFPRVCNRRVVIASYFSRSRVTIKLNKTDDNFNVIFFFRGIYTFTNEIFYRQKSENF